MFMLSLPDNELESSSQHFVKSDWSLPAHGGDLTYPSTVSQADQQRSTNPQHVLRACTCTNLVYATRTLLAVKAALLIDRVQHLHPGM